ncbi:hypothetical protein BJ508DRAFT_335768 [Ascobolus immersus RN42]|uniref:Uncharacterized protein n=1 Tax=Ascobolus immersus RN42 TaxID=1160509 RepID=A0A3N4HFP2_ASCIM|nr:hypothetical protein BJ508DRAFT_335768 [Ascobolus immersus RN42]
MANGSHSSSSSYRDEPAPASTYGVAWEEPTTYPPVRQGPVKYGTGKEQMQYSPSHGSFGRDDRGYADQHHGHERGGHQDHEHHHHDRGRSQSPYRPPLAGDPYNTHHHYDNRSRGERPVTYSGPGSSGSRNPIASVTDAHGRDHSTPKTNSAPTEAWVDPRSGHVDVPNDRSGRGQSKAPGSGARAAAADSKRAVAEPPAKKLKQQSKKAGPAPATSVSSSTANAMAPSPHTPRQHAQSESYAQQQHVDAAPNQLSPRVPPNVNAHPHNASSSDSVAGNSRHPHERQTASSITKGSLATSDRRQMTDGKRGPDAPMPPPSKRRPVPDNVAPAYKSIPLGSTTSGQLSSKSSDCQVVSHHYFREAPTCNWTYSEHKAFMIDKVYHYTGDPFLQGTRFRLQKGEYPMDCQLKFVLGPNGLYCGLVTDEQMESAGWIDSVLAERLKGLDACGHRIRVRISWTTCRQMGSYELWEGVFSYEAYGCPNEEGQGPALVKKEQHGHRDTNLGYDGQRIKMEKI